MAVERIRRKCIGKYRQMNSNYQGYIRDHSEEQSNRNQYERCEKGQELLVNETGEKKQ